MVLYTVYPLWWSVKPLSTIPAALEEWNRWQERKSEKRLAKLAALVKAGRPKVEIAKLLGVSRVRVYQLIGKAKKRGLL